MEEGMVSEDDPVEVFEVLETAYDVSAILEEDAPDGYTGDLVRFETREEVFDFLERLATYREQRWADKMQRCISVNVLVAFNAVTIAGIWAFLVNGDARLLVGDSLIAIILGVLAEIFRRKR